VLLLSVFFLNTCNKDGGPSVPRQVKLIYPENNSACITGITVTEETSEVTFIWEPSKPAAEYVIEVFQLGKGLFDSTITIVPEVSFILDKGKAYSWQVTAFNAFGEGSPVSESWQFYNAGAQRFYPPFPAVVQAPSSGASVYPDVNGAITLRWSSADADNDLSEIEIFIGTDPESMNSTAVFTGQQTSFSLFLNSGTRYFWEVLCRDAQGNSSRSGVYDFRVL
jgi:hypothetical protein